MCAERDDTSLPHPESVGVASPAPTYDPPAIAWDEPFSTTIAASCALTDPLNGCDVRGHLA